MGIKTSQVWTESLQQAAIPLNLPHLYQYQNELNRFIGNIRQPDSQKYPLITQQQVADSLGIKNRSLISRYESGEVANIPFNYLVGLANLRLTTLPLDEQGLFLIELNKAITHGYQGNEVPLATVEALQEYAASKSKDLDSVQADAASKSKDLDSVSSPRQLPLPVVDPTRTRLRLAAYQAEHQLFGVKPAQARLMAALKNRQDYWIMSIDGAGGMGKTTLAWQLTELCRDDFHDILWWSAKQEKFELGVGTRPIDKAHDLKVASLIDDLLQQLDPDLQTGRPLEEKKNILAYWLQQKPYLVVIDNLESMQEHDELLPTLRSLTRPTKFLLTTRWLEEKIGFRVELTEWLEDEATAFLKYWGDYRQLPAATDFELRQIYEVVGGNPLALKLVVGQLEACYKPAQVLAELRQGKSQYSDKFYTYIYRLAWDSLTEISRQLLLQLLLVHQREELEFEFPPERLDVALRQLQARSLIEARGAALEQRNYYLHQLTRTFLETEIIQLEKWV